MKICLITPNVFPVPATKGGACETLVNNLIDENEKEGKLEFICVSIFEKTAFEKSKKYLKTKFIYIDTNNENIKDLSFKTFDDNFINYMDKAYEKIKNIDFDYLIVEGGDLRAYNHLVSKFPKNKCIAHVHGNYIGDEIMDKTYGYFFAVSDFIANKLKSNKIIKDERVKRIYNGVKLENFDKKITTQEKNIIKHKYGIKNDENVIIFCGRTVKRKGIKELILAFKKIKNNKTKLLIIGNANFANQIRTDYDKEIQEEAKIIQDKVIFSGYIPNEELYKIYNIADIAIFPTLSEEAFGLVVVEAMASGCPVILTQSGGFPEIVKDTSMLLLDKNENLIEQLTKSIDYLLDNPTIRKKLSIEGKLKSKEFSNQKFYENFVNSLEYIEKQMKQK